MKPQTSSVNRIDSSPFSFQVSNFSLSWEYALSETMKTICPIYKTQYTMTTWKCSIVSFSGHYDRSI